MYHPLSSSILLPPRTRFLPTIPVVSTSIPPPNPEYPCISCWKICGHGCFDWPQMGSGDDQMPHGSNWNHLPTNAPRKKTEDFFVDLRTESLSLVNCCKREKLWTNQKFSAATCNLKSCCVCFQFRFSRRTDLVWHEHLGAQMPTTDMWYTVPDLDLTQTYFQGALASGAKHLLRHTGENVYWQILIFEVTLEKTLPYFYQKGQNNDIYLIKHYFKYVYSVPSCSHHEVWSRIWVTKVTSFVGASTRASRVSTRFRAWRTRV